MRHTHHGTSSADQNPLELNRSPPLIRILRTLLHTALHGVAPQGGSDREITLRNGSRSQWSAAVRILEQHRLTPLVACVLRRHDLIELIPEPSRSELLSAYRETLFANTLHRAALERVLVDLNRHGMVPVVFKGIVLASSYYPDIGARPMGDVDIFLADTGVDATGVDACLNESGFRPLAGSGDNNNNNYQNARGTVLDVHHRFRLFEGRFADGLECPWTRPAGNSGVAKTWEPNAMLVHLSNHLRQHRPGRGLVLLWLLDLAFVIQRHRSELEHARIRHLSPSDDSLAFLLRILRFVQTELEVALPASLTEPVRRSAPLELARILRERRTRPWGLLAPRGWARLVKARLSGRAGEHRFFPTLSDLALWPFDQLHEARLGRR